MNESKASQGAPKKELQGSLLASGIPLEMAVYDLLASDLDADWIEPEYEFTTLDETGTVKQRSVDFVASVPIGRDPLNTESIHLYILTECKYSNPRERTWLFMPDVFPTVEMTFGDWRPALWQDRPPREPLDTTRIDGIVSQKVARGNINDGLTRCVRGAVLGEKDGKKLPILTSGISQLRDCLHHLALERVRLFTKQWSKPAALVFVPIVITNAQLHVLKPEAYRHILDGPKGAPFAISDVTTACERILVRCPSSLDKVDWNWQRFQAAHGTYDLSRVEKGLPFYKRERTIEAHFRNFFTTAPSYITVVRLNEMPKFLAEVLAWAKKLEFP